MNCISEALIQKYIDGEAQPEERLAIEEHAASCSKCQQSIAEQTERSKQIKASINLLAGSTLGRPAHTEIDLADRRAPNLSNKPEKPGSSPKELTAGSIWLKRAIISLSAASVLLFCFVYFSKDSSETKSHLTGHTTEHLAEHQVEHPIDHQTLAQNEELGLMPAHYEEVDANRSILNQELLIQIEDANGNISEYYVSQ